MFPRIIVLISGGQVWERNRSNCQLFAFSVFFASSRVSGDNWLNGRDIVEFLGLWEILHNPSFKRIEFDTFKTNAGTNAFVFSIKDWVVAPSVQKNIYGVLMPSVFIYGMMTIEGRRYGFSKLVEACREMDLNMVPVIEKSAFIPDALDLLLRSSEGKSVLADVPREGVVWRAVSANKDIHFKVKSRPYKVWYDKKMIKQSEVCRSGPESRMKA